MNHYTIDVCRIGGAGQFRCGGGGGAILFELVLGLRSFATDKLFALPVFAFAVWNIAIKSTINDE